MKTFWLDLASSDDGKLPHSLLSPDNPELPTTNELSEAEEVLGAKRLGEDVSLLLSGWHPLQVENAIGILLCFDTGKEVVVLDSNVLGPWAKLGSLSKVNTARVVLITLGIDCVTGMNFLEVVNHINC